MNQLAQRNYHKHILEINPQYSIEKTLYKFGSGYHSLDPKHITHSTRLYIKYKKSYTIRKPPHYPKSYIGEDHFKFEPTHREVPKLQFHTIPQKQTEENCRDAIY